MSRKIISVQAIVPTSKYRLHFDGPVSCNGETTSSDGNPDNDPFNVFSAPPDRDYQPVANADGTSVDLPFGDGVGAGNDWANRDLPWLEEEVAAGSGKTV